MAKGVNLSEPRGGLCWVVYLHRGSLYEGHTDGDSLCHPPEQLGVYTESASPSPDRRCVPGFFLCRPPSCHRHLQGFDPVGPEDLLRSFSTPGNHYWGMALRRTMNLYDAILLGTGNVLAAGISLHLFQHFYPALRDLQVLYGVSEID